MTVASVEVTAGSGTHLWTDSRPVSAVTRHAQFVLLAEPTYATYTARADNISIATSADHILQIMGDGTNYSRLMAYSISITADRPAADATVEIHLLRLSTAGTGGSAVTPNPNDSADTYAGGAMTLPSAKGTEGSGLRRHYFHIPTAFPSTTWQPVQWEAKPRSKPIIFGTGTGNGVAFKIVTGIASCTVQIMAELTVTSFL